jgi:hypothetical protein
MTLSAAAPNSPTMTVMPASAASPLRAALQESACSSAMARRPGPKADIVASGKTMNRAPASAASRVKVRTLSRFSGTEVVELI